MKAPMLLGALALAFCVPPPLCAADWPQARYDARRSAISPQELDGRLNLHWTRALATLSPAWADQAKMQFDANYDPIVVGKRLIVGSPAQDWVAGFDTETGAESWRFYADGPVRLAPAAWQDRVYAGSDDGYLYCLEAATGKLLWKFQGAPTDRRVLGNGRLISTWPVRGGPVVADGTVYFAAGIWPFMGIFLYALDARTGQVIWVNDGDGSIYIKQPHSTDSFAGVAPQGSLAVLGDRLLVPSGRSVPGCYDRKTGKLLYYLLGENGKRGGGSEIAAAGALLFNGGAVFDVATEKYLGAGGDQVLPGDEVLLVHTSGKLKALDAANASIKVVEAPDKKGVLVKTARWTIDTLAESTTPKLTVLIQAGTRLVAGAPGRILAYDLPVRSGMEPSWEAEIEGTPVRLLAADDRLFVVTQEDRLYCFGAGARPMQTHALPEPAEMIRDSWTLRARSLVQTTGVRAGYAVVWGAGNGRLVNELAQQSECHILVVDPDEARVAQLRAVLTAEGLYGNRVAVHVGEPGQFRLPPYLASLMVLDEPKSKAAAAKPDVLRQLYQAVRPYGGVIRFPSDRDAARTLEDARLEQAVVRAVGGHALLVREGALPGAGNWTHEHADAANTRVARDSRVMAPLGLLWFGGPTHDGILPRHGHGPMPQVIDGRLLIEGIDMLRAIDIYTGRLLWESPLPGVGNFYNNTAHQPGANATGTNYISTSDTIYIVHAGNCVLLDPETGDKKGQFQLPPLNGMKDSPRWGYINVAGDYLVGGADPLFDPKLAEMIADAEKKATGDDDKDRANPLLKALTAVTRGGNDNLSSSKHLVVMDRHSGKVLWTATARHGFRHNAICVGGGRLYAIDRLSGMQLDRLKRRGETPSALPQLLALDLKAGKELWRTEEDVFGTWLSYSEEHDILVEAGRIAGDVLNDEARGMRAYQAATGKVRWMKDHRGPAMLHGSTILMAGAGCDLLTGDLKMRTDPLTGEPVEWKWYRNYGCNTPAASEHLMTFRSGAAGYFDLCNDGGTGNFGGFRSSCTNNLIVAGGVIAAPDYTRTCTCSYQIQTSVGLVHDPEVEMWTFTGSGGPRGPVQRLGLNLGAPGDRKADDGTLWLDYPSVGGASPAVAVKAAGEHLEWFRRHSVRVAGDRNWVAASGARGLNSITVALGNDADAPRSYTVRLHFMEPDEIAPGQRVFSVALQGQVVLNEMDIVKEAGRPLQAVVREFKGVRAGPSLTVNLDPAAGTKVPAPILCGIELVAE